MSDIIDAFLLVFAAMFPIVEPLGSAPIFLSLTADHTPEERTRLARDVAINSFFMMLGSLLFGSKIVEFFGVEIPVVRVAGSAFSAYCFDAGPTICGSTPGRCFFLSWRRPRFTRSLSFWNIWTKSIRLARS